VYATRSNAGHAAVDGLVSWAVPVRWTAATPGALTVTTLAQSRRQQLPGTVFVPTPFATLDSDRELAAIELTGATGRGTWITRAWGRRDGLHLTDPEGATVLSPTRADQAITAAGASVGWGGRPARDVTLSATVDGSGERFAPGVTEGEAIPPAATRGSAGLGLDAAWRPASAWIVAASGRLDDWSNSSAGQTTSDLFPTGHVGVEANVLDVATVAAHGGATARAPSFIELYGDRGAFVGNPGLVPESAWSVDAGARTSRRLGPVRLALEVDGFWTRAQDLITFIPLGAFGRDAKATNIGLAHLMGLEVDLRAVAGPVELRGSYTGLLTENDSACEAIVGPCQHPPLVFRPADDLVADGIVTVGPARLRAGLDAISGVVSDLAGSIGVPARVLVSAGVRVEVAPGVRVALDVRNLLDERTATYAGALGPVHEPIGDYYAYPLPGRAFLASVRFSEPAEEAR
jgi:outer membrane receptor protein involved in Fe transport